MDWCQLPKTKKEMNRHSTCMRKIFKIGGAHEDQRMLSALKSEDSPAPNLYLLWKDHKQYKDVPPTGPVCSAVEGPLVIMSDFLLCS